MTASIHQRATGAPSRRPPQARLSAEGLEGNLATPLHRRHRGATMNRRQFLVGAASMPLLGSLGPLAAPPASAAQMPGPFRRVRPNDADWPQAADWAKLDEAVGGRLVKLGSPLGVCREPVDRAACDKLFKELKNPYYVGDAPDLTQTCGWVDAWMAQPSAYAVAARSAADVAAAVDFARERRLRLVVKGGGHSYLGTSNAPDSLLIWTRAMSDIALEHAFVGRGCEGKAEPQPAVTVGAGAIWMHAYNEVTTKGGRYVQGGGCGTVGVAGLVQGGGFGSYSKEFGTAAASLIEAEIVTANGKVRTVNACSDPDLFWALKGGGGGTFGVVTRLTLKAHELPQVFGVVSATIMAKSDAAFRGLIGRFLDFCAANLLSRHWGNVVTLRPGNKLEIGLEFLGFDEEEARRIWRPFLDWVAGDEADYAFASDPFIRSAPMRNRWDPQFFRRLAPQAIVTDDREGAPPENIFWKANLAEAGHVLYGFQSLWLHRALLDAGRREEFADRLTDAGRLSPVELHFQKGLAGATAETLAAVRETPMNPAVLDAFALAIVAGEGPPAFPGIPGHEPRLAEARWRATLIGAAMGELRKIAGNAGAYVAESDYFERDWQRSYWGDNYERLLAVKRTYDPDGLFFARHGVGSEGWSDDGFTRLA
jgi:FAD/FMN-containing dehydrogenase